MNANGQLVAALARSEMFQRYERAYTEVTGLPLTLRPVENWQLPFHGRHGENGWCALMAERNRTCAACLQVQEKLTESAREQPATVTCAFGLCELAVPVKLGDQTIGLVQTGQAMCRKPGEPSFHRAMEQAGRLGVDLEPVRARAAYFASPVVSQRKLESVTDLLINFAEHLSVKSNQIAVQAANAEPPLVTRAKQFIRDHHAEDLSLGQVASAVHASVFHLCKVFRKSAGMTFTEFVSRTRIEKAKQFLLNPNPRVSEIAYEVGFQSLTHFNRVFKKIVGQSPSEYRDRLPGG